MEVVVYLIGLSHVVLSALCILYARESMSWIQGLFKTYPLKYLSGIPLLYGFLFLISASAISYPWLFRFLGLLALCEAVVAFTNPQNLYGRLLDGYFENISERTHQLFGIIGVIFGTLVLTWVQ
ncbi:MAG: hypothetical protein LJE65_12115 [Desulfobacteraceae bacterium]|nr:hypothetical protein [Desulfobacteraceae bacterium]